MQILERMLILTLLCGSSTLAQPPQVRPQTARQRALATSSTLKSGVVTGAHGAAAGVWRDADGKLHTGHAAGTAVKTQNGSAVAGRAGTQAIDQANKTAEGHHAGGIVTSDGRAAGYRQQGNTQWDENSYQHHGEGQVESASGKGGSYTRDVDVEKTGDGYTRQSDVHLETNSGNTYDLEREKEVSKTGDGYERNVSGSAVKNAGQADEQSAQWQRDLQARRTATGGEVKRSGSAGSLGGKSRSASTQSGTSVKRTAPKSSGAGGLNRKHR